MTAQSRAFVEAEQASGRNVVKACQLLDVSRSAYYQWHQHLPSARALSDAELTERITKIHAASRDAYGMPRIHAELRDLGFHVGRKRVARLMVAAGLAGRCRRRRTTFADPETKALNLLNRVFGPENILVDTRWAGDVTWA